MSAIAFFFIYTFTCTLKCISASSNFNQKMQGSKTFSVRNKVGLREEAALHLFFFAFSSPENVGRSSFSPRSKLASKETRGRMEGGRRRGGRQE